MKNTFVKDIKSGDRVIDNFLVTEKNLAFSQKGTPYVSMRLRDKTGEIEARIWDNVEELRKKFKKGDVIQINSRAVSFRQNLQLSVSHVENSLEAEINPADFSPCSKHDIEAMFAEIRQFGSGIQNPHLKGLLEQFWADEQLVGKFKHAPAAKGLHHVYIGGLLEHTLSVVRIIDKIAVHYEIDRDLLIVGGVLHDIGKIHELTCDKLMDYTDEGRLIGHIVIGLEILDSKISQTVDFPAQLALELRHMLISHHGALEYGSPKRPKTLEAQILHQIDDLDAKVNAFQTHIGISDDTDSDWTIFHRLFERYIYKGKKE